VEVSAAGTATGFPVACADRSASSWVTAVDDAAAGFVVFGVVAADRVPAAWAKGAMVSAVAVRAMVVAIETARCDVRNRDTGCS
jgi:hypothetical protein